MKNLYVNYYAAGQVSHNLESPAVMCYGIEVTEVATYQTNVDTSGIVIRKSLDGINPQW